MSVGWAIDVYDNPSRRPRRRCRAVVTDIHEPPGIVIETSLPPTFYGRDKDAALGKAHRWIDRQIAYANKQRETFVGGTTRRQA